MDFHKIEFTLGQTNTKGQVAAIEGTKEDPQSIIVQPSPIQYLNYGIQGVIVAFIVYFGKPLADSIISLFSENAKRRREKEDHALDAQIKMQDKMQEFLQKMVSDQQVSNNLHTVEILKQIIKDLEAIDNSIRELRIEVINLTNSVKHN